MYSTRTVHGFFLCLVSVLSVICALNVPLVDDLLFLVYLPAIRSILPFTDGNESVMVADCFIHDVLKRDIEQHRR